MKGIKIEDLNPKYQEEARAQLAVRPAKQKRNREPTLEQAQDVPTLHAPVRLTITVCKTGGNWDVDNTEIKGLIDGLSEAGILYDDTIKEIPVIIKEGCRCETRDEERTVIVLEEI